MNDTLRISDLSIMYQGTQPAYLVTKNKISYCQIQGSFENEAVHLDYNILFKTAYAKKAKFDLIKDNKVILQKKGNEFFVLISVDAAEYAVDEKGLRSVSGKLKKSDYEYSYSFQELDKEKVVKDTVEQNSQQILNSILEKNGISTTGKTASDSIAATWSIGHPDEK